MRVIWPSDAWAKSQSEFRQTDAGMRALDALICHFSRDGKSPGNVWCDKNCRFVESVACAFRSQLTGSAASAFAIRQIGRTIDDSVSMAAAGALNSSPGERMTDFAVVKLEFDETLGYIRQDLRWLLEKQSSLNYTIALLIGCGCEMLAACGGDKTRHGERVFAELLPPTKELQALANRLYSALRDGLAHGFDTKHLRVDGTEHQVYLSSLGAQEFTIVRNERGIGLRIGIGALAEGLCVKITEFEGRLEHDGDARQRFMNARLRPADLSATEAAAWRALVATHLAV
jgi:hypothetical protein